MQLKKIIAAGAMGLMMAGSTVAFAATLADFPQPFVTSTGAADFLTVVGQNAKPDDVVASINLAARLGGEVYTSYTCAGSVGGSTVSGEGKAVATSNTKIYLDDTLLKAGARYVFTSSDLSTTLADGMLEDTQSTQYNYAQYIELSDDFTVKFAQYDSGTVQDPRLFLSGTNSASASNYVYKTKVVFEKEVNDTYLNDQTIELFGNTYAIAPGTSFIATTAKLVLSGASNTQVLTERETVTVEVDGTTYDVTLAGVSDQDTAVIKVGTDQKSIDEDQQLTIGGIQVYVSDVFYYGATRTDNQVKVSFGAETITLEDGKEAYTTVSGTKTNIKGTYVDLALSEGKLTMIEVYVTGPKSGDDILEVGSSFTDPVFKSFDLSFAATTPDLESSAKSTLEVKNAGDTQLTATFTDYRGEEVSLTWANYDGSIDLEDGSDYAYIVVEGATIAENQYVVVNAGDYAHIFQLTSLDIDGSETGSIELTDAVTGTTYDILMGTDNSSQKVIDGQTYWINGTDTAVYITWGDNSGYLNPGNVTIWPTIPGANGEKYAFADNPTTVTYTTGDYWILPTGKVLLSTYEDGNALLNITAASGYVASGCTAQNVTLGATCDLVLGKTATGGSYYDLTIANSSITIKPAGSDGTAYTEPAIVLVEEEDSASNVYSVWVEAANGTVSSNALIQSGSPDFTYSAYDSAALKSDSDKTQYLDVYGVFAEKNADGQDTVTLWYPDEQATMDFFVLGSTGVVSTQAAVSGESVKATNPIKTSVAKLDKDVIEADKSDYNIILVGGPAVNSLVVTLADAGKTKDRAWYLEQGEGTALIDLINDAFVSGKSVLVAAGYSAADTQAATNVLFKYDANTATLKGTRVILKNGVWSQETA